MSMTIIDLDRDTRQGWQIKKRGICSGRAPSPVRSELQRSWSSVSASSLGSGPSGFPPPLCDPRSCHIKSKFPYVRMHTYACTHTLPGPPMPSLFCNAIFSQLHYFKLRTRTNLTSPNEHIMIADIEATYFHESKINKITRAIMRSP